MRRLDRTLAPLLGLVLAGCTLGPDFETPKMFQPDTWFAPAPKPDPVASLPVNEPIRADWWALLGDPELTSLEQRVADANPDVRVATLRLAESRAQRRITAADEFPQVNGAASYVRQKPSPKGEFSLLGGGGAGGASGVPSSAPIKPFNLWQYGFDASWELDLWGKVRRSVEAADASVDASAEARRDILLSTMAEVARDYVQLRDVQDQLRIARANRDVSEQGLRLTRQQAAHGMTTQLDVASSAAQLASVAATIPQLEQREAAAINQLGFLMGEPPRALAAELSAPRAVPPVPPQVPIGLPSELARRRPDIREAEAKLHAATAEIGVAEAAFYPSVTLNGSLDIQAIHFNNLASWDARTYSFGPSISIPIFEGGKLKGNLELTKAEQQEAAITFQKTVLNAWSEVDNALVAYDAEQRRDVQLRVQVDQTHQALGLAQQQYRRGETDFLHVLDAQRQVLSAEQQEADSRATISTNLVMLYKSLGGGWDKDA
ncbi:MAG TPA: efflux transporter outer membrane subunit, partial [Aliidongia sp.]|uniref:efflux transporter outer membrane subunit n=1 Tax=Aliidongia sp. TaxID=1914230 RepID=UPI002DDCDA76